jgi:hypothetical protein
MQLHKVDDRTFEFRDPAAAVPTGAQMGSNLICAMRRELTVREKKQLLVRWMKVFVLHGSLPIRESEARQ